MIKISRFIALCLSGLLMQSLFAANNNSLIGFWKTIDDVTGQAKAIVQIQETPNKSLTGNVVKLFHDKSKLCTKCSGLRKNQPILGMVIMEGLKQSPDSAGQWNNGEILDPKNGKTYHCNLQVVNQGQGLQVRGYIGVPLFGRSQTWIRVLNPQMS